MLLVLLSTWGLLSMVSPLSSIMVTGTARNGTTNVAACESSFAFGPCPYAPVYPSTKVCGAIYSAATWAVLCSNATAGVDAEGCTAAVSTWPLDLDAGTGFSPVPWNTTLDASTAQAATEQYYPLAGLLFQCQASSPSAADVTCVPHAGQQSLVWHAEQHFKQQRQQMQAEQQQASGTAPRCDLQALTKAVILGGLFRVSSATCDP
jgi:hypothetical protein